MYEFEAAVPSLGFLVKDEPLPRVEFHSRLNSRGEAHGKHFSLQDKFEFFFEYRLMVRPFRLIRFTIIITFTSSSYGTRTHVLDLAISDDFNPCKCSEHTVGDLLTIRVF